MNKDQTRIECRRVRIAEYSEVYVDRLMGYVFFAVWRAIILSAQESVVCVWQNLANSIISKHIKLCTKASLRETLAKPNLKHALAMYVFSIPGALIYTDGTSCCDYAREHAFIIYNTLEV
jgi:hypothetical protein